MDYTTVVAVAAFFMSAVTAINAFFTLRRNAKEAKQPLVDDHELLMEHERKLKSDYERDADFRRANELQMKALLQIIDHELDNNHFDKLAAVRDELQEYLISR